MGIGYILALLVIGLIAAIKFAKLAASKGYKPGRARGYAVVLTLVAAFFWLILLAGSFFLGQMFEPWRAGISLVFHAGNCFLIASLLVILKKAYGNMAQAADARS